MTTRNKNHYPGVKWTRARKRYEATIPILGVPIILGYYLSENAAYMARGEVRKVLISTGHRDMLTSQMILSRPERRHSPRS